MSIKSYFTCTKGATAIEYGLIAASIALAISVALFAFGADLSELFFSRLPGLLNTGN